MRRQTAQVQLALEATAREHFKQLQDSLRRDMYEQIDEKTQLLVRAWLARELVGAGNS